MLNAYEKTFLVFLENVQFDKIFDVKNQEMLDLNNPFHATSLFLYTLETVFLMFSGMIERDQRHEMR